MKNPNQDLKHTAIFVGNDIVLIKKAISYYRSQGYRKAFFDSQRTNYIGTSLDSFTDFVTNYEQLTEAEGFKFIEIPDDTSKSNSIDLGVIHTTIRNTIIYASGERSGKLAWVEDYIDAKYYENIEEFFREYKVKNKDKGKYSFKVIKEYSDTPVLKEEIVDAKYLVDIANLDPVKNEKIK